MDTFLHLIGLAVCGYVALQIVAAAVLVVWWRRNSR
jgi:hypothetical protein